MGTAVIFNIENLTLTIALLSTVFENNIYITYIPYIKNTIYIVLLIMRHLRQPCFHIIII